MPVYAPPVKPYAGIMLILRINFQIMFIGYIHLLQTISALAGLAIIACALLPGVMRHCLMRGSR